MTERRDGIENIKKISELLNGDAMSLLDNVKKSENNLKNIKIRLSEKGKSLYNIKKAQQEEDMKAQASESPAEETHNKIPDEEHNNISDETHNNSPVENVETPVNVKDNDIKKPHEEKIVQVEEKVKPVEIKEKTEPNMEKPSSKNNTNESVKEEVKKDNKKAEEKSEKIEAIEKTEIKADKEEIKAKNTDTKEIIEDKKEPIMVKENIAKINNDSIKEEVKAEIKPQAPEKKEDKPNEPIKKETKASDNMPSWLVRKADKTEEKKPEVKDNKTSGFNRQQRPYNSNNPNGRPPRKEYIASDNNDRNNGYQGRNYNNNYRANPNGGTNPNYQGQRPNNNFSRNNFNNNTTRPFNQNGSRPFNGNNGTRPFNNSARPAVIAPSLPLINKETKSFGNNKKKNNDNKYEEKKTISKRALIKQSVSVEDFDENKTGYRKLRPVKKAKAEEQVSQFIKIENAVINTEIIPLKVLSEKIGVSAIDLTKKLFKEGIMKTINDSIDFDTAQYIASDLGVTLELKLEKTAEDKLSEGFEEEADDESKMVKRPPVVTVMGHVDHGKTSLLDKIRKTSVTAGEAGGITQHIGAYQVSINGKPITFLDTPGHAAFTAMRARGAQATDIAVLVVAADDGIMPQTIEAINHAKSANVPIIVAINKIDKPEANIERIKTQLTEQGLVPEEWGGDVMVCPVSAKSGEGIDNLLESIILLADLRDLKANPDRKAKGVVIEAKLDQSKGPIATVLIQAGTLKVGDPVIIGTVIGKVRAMVDDKGRKINSAGLSVPVSVMGLDDVPNAGDILYAVSQQLTKQVAEERKNKAKENELNLATKVTLDDVFNKIAEGEMKTLNIIVKADVQGSAEAVKQSLSKLGNEEVKVNVIHSAAGAINETDVMLAESSKAIIIGFNVRPDSKAKQAAESGGVDVRLYRIIYEAIDDVEKALKGMLTPKFREVYMGKAEVRNTFKITGVGMVAGCYVVEGKIIRNGKLRIYRDNVMICEGNVLQLKRFKDDVKEVMQGFECGISIEKFNDIKNDDYIECYLVEQIEN